MTEKPDRQAQDFARLAHISPGHLSGLRRGGGFSDAALAGILEALGLGLEEGVHEAIAWAKTQPKPKVASSKNLQIAIESVERDGTTVSPVVRETVQEMLETGAAMELDRWVQTIRALCAVDATGRLRKRMTDGQDLVARHARRPTKATSTNRARKPR